MITYKKFSVFVLVSVLIIGGGFFSPEKVQAAGPLTPTDVVYRDSDNNGQVDTVQLIFVDVTTCAYEAGDWAVGVAGSIGVTAVTGITNTGTCAGDNFINVSVVASAGITGGATNPRIDYTDTGTLGSITADTNQDSTNFTALDAAGPVIVSATTLGPNNFQINFSEAILESSFADGDLEFQNINSVADTFILDANLDPDTDALFFVATVLNPFAVDENTGEVHFDAAGVIFDLAGVNNTQTADVTITDGIAPEVMSATTGDNDSDGKIDRLTVVYTEAVVDADFNAVAVTGYVVPGTGSGSGSATIVYNLTEGASADTGATPVLNFGPANAADVNGNPLNNAGAPANATDGAGPAIFSARSISTTQVEVTFSESISDASVIAVDVTFDFIDASADGIASAFSSGTADDNKGTFTVAGGGAIGASESTGTVALEVAGVVSDGTNVSTQTATVTVADGIAPTIISSTGLDSDADGKTNSYTIAFSEVLTVKPVVANSNFTARNATTLGAITISTVDIGFNALTEVVLNLDDADADNYTGVIEFSYNSAGGSFIIEDASAATNDFTNQTNTAMTDDVEPTVTVTMDDASMNIGDTSNVTFTFSEAPTGFTSADVTVASGTIGAINTANPLVQTAVFTPTNGIVEAINVITVGTVWTDAATNTGVGDDSPNYTIDTTAPGTPTASPVAGTYTSTQSVTLSSTGSTSIRFTTDGTTPTCVSGILYTGGFNVSSTRTVKAVGCLSGNASPVGSFAYTLNVSSSGGSSGGSISKAPIAPTAAPAPASAGECKLGDLFSTTSGKPCPPPAPDCTATTAYSASTGQLCPVISPPSPAPVPTPQFIGSPEYFTRNLTIGSIGEDVRRLQVFLNTRGFILISFGLGSPGNETAKFGALTRAALARFQQANGIVPPVGFFGPITRALINSRL